MSLTSIGILNPSQASAGEFQVAGLVDSPRQNDICSAKKTPKEVQQCKEQQSYYFINRILDGDVSKSENSVEKNYPSLLGDDFQHLRLKLLEESDKNEH